MALKRLERPSRRLLQRCYSTLNPQPPPSSRLSKRHSAPKIKTLLLPSATRSFTSASLAPHLSRRKPPSVLSSTGPVQIFSRRSISSSAVRSATPQEAQGSQITASYIASAGELELVDVKKVLVIGSGGLSIGQAGEFDYSGMRESAVLPLSKMLISWVYRFTSTESIERGECRLSSYQSKYRHYTDGS